MYYANSFQNFIIMNNGFIMSTNTAEAATVWRKPHRCLPSDFKDEDRHSHLQRMQGFRQSLGWQRLDQVRVPQFHGPRLARAGPRLICPPDHGCLGVPASLNLPCSWKSLRRSLSLHRKRKLPTGANKRFQSIGQTVPAPSSLSALSCNVRCSLAAMICWSAIFFSEYSQKTGTDLPRPRIHTHLWMHCLPPSLDCFTHLRLFPDLPLLLKEPFLSIHSHKCCACIPTSQSTKTVSFSFWHLFASFSVCDIVPPQVEESQKTFGTHWKAFGTHWKTLGTKQKLPT